MKFWATLLGSLAFTASVNAQYYSEGWKPGQPVTSQSVQSTASVPASTPTAQAPAKGLAGLFDLTNLLTSGPIADLAARAGYNLTEKLADIRSRKLWDDRISLITDDNYEDIIVNEDMTPEEEKKRVWVLVITISSTGQEGISPFVDKTFDSAYDLSVKAKDLPHVRWGRIDYMNVTAITTKWAVWTAPYIVILTDRGKSLRFYRATQIRVNDEVIRKFLKEEGWKAQKPWKSIYAPGGEREWVMDYLATVLTKIYNTMRTIPKWMVYLSSGAIGSLLLGLMHGASKNRAPKPAVKAAPKAEAESQTQSVPNSTTATPAPIPIRSSSVSSTASKSATKRGTTKSKKTTKK